MKPISPFGLPIGISVAFWTCIGLLRLVSEKIRNPSTPKKRKRRTPYNASDIAVIMSAHDEELVIRKSIQSLKLCFSEKQIFVASDGSTDKTTRRARMEGCHVSGLIPGIGKGKALVYLLKRYHLFERYKLIFIIDADTRIDKNFVKQALAMFRDPDTSVLFASGKVPWPHHIIPQLRLYFISYRDRLNRLLVYFFIYGQTWKYTNVNYVIPGFCTVYKSEALKQLEIDTPGLLIEDFNLAFQFHKKKLGKIGYDHTLYALEQYPDNLKDYWNQVRRWNIGFFQTIRKNGIWPSFFWIAVGIFSLEVLINSIYIIVLPLVIFFIVITFLSTFFPSLQAIAQYEPDFFIADIKSILITVFIIDYLYTILIAYIQKRPQYLIYGLFFFFLHFITSLILLTSLYPGFFGKSEGKWTSPKRHTIGQT